MGWLKFLKNVAIKHKDDIILLLLYQAPSKTQHAFIYDRYTTLSIHRTVFNFILNPI